MTDKPKDLLAEQAVLGALLIEKRAYAEVSHILKPENFFKDAHRLIYEAVSSVFADKSPVDMLTIKNHLAKRGVLETAGGVIYLTELSGKVASTANIVFHAQIIYDKWLAREQISLHEKSARELYADKSSPQDVLVRSRHALSNLRYSPNSGEFHDIRVITTERVKELEKRMGRYRDDNNYIPGVPTGLYDLDMAINGLPNDLITVAARPQMGKTSMVVQNFARTWGTMGLKTPFYSLEMPVDQLTDRLLCSVAEVGFKDYMKGAITEYEFGRIMVAQDAVANCGLEVDDRVTQTPDTIHAGLVGFAHNWGGALIDNVQIASAGDKKGNRREEVTYITRRLKEISQGFNKPVVQVSHLGRDVESRRIKLPEASDMKESGSIEQDSGLILGIYRPIVYGLSYCREMHKDILDNAMSAGYYPDQVDDLFRKLTIVRILKGRNYANGHIFCLFDGPKMTFKTIEDETLRQVLGMDPLPGSYRPMYWLRGNKENSPRMDNPKQTLF